jgi:hypothetical protein
MSEDSNSQPKNVLPDLIIPVMALVFTAYYLTTITEVPWIAQASAILVSAMLSAAIFAFAIRTYLRMRGGQERISWSAIEIDRVSTVKRIALLALTITYIAVIEYLGFTITTFLFVFSAVLLLSSLAHWRSALAVSFSCATLGYVVFIYFFQTRFPRGPVENFLKGVL